jgi:hypothetical protein
MNSFVSAALALAVLASFLLMGFGVAGLVRQSMKPLRAWLMIAAAIITMLNVLALVRV